MKGSFAQWSAFGSLSELQMDAALQLYMDAVLCLFVFCLLGGNRVLLLGANLSLFVMKSFLNN